MEPGGPQDCKLRLTTIRDRGAGELLEKPSISYLSSEEHGTIGTIGMNGVQPTAKLGGRRANVGRCLIVGYIVGVRLWWPPADKPALPNCHSRFPSNRERGGVVRHTHMATRRARTAVAWLRDKSHHPGDSKKSGPGGPALSGLQASDAFLYP